MQATSTGPAVHFLNIEYFFRILYEWLHSQGGANLDTGNLSQALTHTWDVVTALAYLVSIIAIMVLAYYTIRIRQIAEQEHHLYTTLDSTKAETERDHSRWHHILTLIESGTESDWRQAIIEADVMLYDLLTQLGYEGESTGEKLKRVNAEHFRTLNEAWEAHKIRNEIAHQGSAFQLSDHLAYRTIGQYEAVFREFNEI